jgi:hypothetical protein
MVKNHSFIGERAVATNRRIKSDQAFLRREMRNYWIIVRMIIGVEIPEALQRTVIWME